eukprot:TRINITY_DN5961_c0_g4_i1.p1 TRINITY_DN5961_c0_g4~~TRINITY_DN5961_c0_g4_i1.p1  ORF type:complete len:2533 (+),score=974.82 TRINITY_DN5961_c0_g4_i1:472-7599(+)
MEAAGVDGMGSVALRGLARRKLEVVSNSLADNNRSTSGMARNLNDLWVRFKLLVDTTAGGSLLELLHASNVGDFEDVQVLSLSALSYDELMPVTVVSQIAAAMESGTTVWLTNTRAIDASLFDVFNQSYQCCTNGRNEVLHFVALAVGATLEYKRVHKNFQAIVHVTQNELTPDKLPSPFLNRLEKFTVGVEDVVEHAIHCLPPADRARAAWTREKLGRFVRALSAGADRCLFTAHTQDTLDSLVLEAVHTGRVEDVAPDPRYAQGEGVAAFMRHDDPSTRLWRNRAMRLLQLCRPEGMLLAQDTLQQAASYVQAYFLQLSPCSLRGYMRFLHGQAKAAAPQDGGAAWGRVMVYSPDNVDFASVVASEDYATLVSLDALARAERGVEDLQEELYRFAEAPERTVFVLLVAPRFLGHPAVREVRHLIETKAAASAGPRPKTVVLLQAFPPQEASSSFTPLFCTGWNQMYVDCSADLLHGCRVTDYVRASVLGAPREARGVPSWDADLVPLLGQALAEVDAGQGEAAASARREDGVGELFDVRGAFARRLQLLQGVLRRCPGLRAAVVRLCAEHEPSEDLLVGIGKDVAARKGAEGGGECHAHSLTAMLLTETTRVHVHILAYAVRLMLEGRNAAALMEAGGGAASIPPEVDDLLAAALALAVAGMGYDDIRQVDVAALPRLVIGATPPALPGSLFLTRLLSVPCTASCAVAEAARLKESSEKSALRGLIDIIHADGAMVTAFWKDSIRERVQHAHDAVERAAVRFALPIMRQRHAEVFGDAAPLQVWSIRALCEVEKPFLSGVLAAGLPLAATGVVDMLDDAALRLPDGASATLDVVDAHRRALLVAAFTPMALATPLDPESALLARSAESTDFPRASTSAAAFEATGGVDGWVAAVAAAVSVPDPAPDARALAIACTVFDAAGGGAPEAAVKAWQRVLDAPLLENYAAAVAATPAAARPREAVLRGLAHAYQGGGGDVALLKFLVALLAEWEAEGAPGGRGVAYAVVSAVLDQGDGAALMRTAPLSAAAKLVEALDERRGGAECPTLSLATPAGARSAKQADAAWLDEVAYSPDRVGDAPDAARNAWIGGVVPPAVCMALYDCFTEALKGVSVDAAADALEAAKAAQLVCLKGTAAGAPRGGLMGSVSSMVGRLAGAKQEHAPVATPALAAASVLAAACRQAFLDALAGRLVGDGGKQGKLELPAAVMRCIKDTLVQPGWKAPKKASDAPAAPLRQKYVDNVHTFLSAVQRTHGTAAMLRFMAEKTDALGAVCGDVLKHSCANSSVLKTLPSDLPFVFTSDDPLHEPFIRVRELMEGVDAVGGDGVGTIVEEIARYVKAAQDIAQRAAEQAVDEAVPAQPKMMNLTLTGLRLVLFYTAGREYLGAKKSFAGAEELSGHPALARLLSLTPRHQALLRVLLDPGHLGTGGDGCALTDAAGPLRKGHADPWTAAMLPVIATAAAVPQSFLHTLALDIDSVKDSYIVGDRTGGNAHHGGDYKFDCVTQLDADGQLTSYASGQDTMAVGSCYLLWLVEFGALAWQAALAPPTHQVMWDYMFSGDLKARQHGYQQRMSDHQLLVANMTERSQTYLLHLGMRVGLSVDEASRLVARFCYNLVECEAVPRDDNTAAVQAHPLLAKAYTTRDAAKHAERHIDTWYKAAVGAHRAALGPPDADVCKTLHDLRAWQRERRVAALPTAFDMSALFKSDAAKAAPLLGLYLAEGGRLGHLAGLLKGVAYFATAVHAGLSGRVEATDASQPMVSFFPRCFRNAALADAHRRWAALRDAWNTYVTTIGPIGYQCGEEGEITFTIEEAAPLSLFLTLAEGEGGLAGHQNIVANMFTSLQRVYNEVQRHATRRCSALCAAEVDLVALCSDSEQLTLRHPQRLSELCLASFLHRTAENAPVVDWPAVERRLFLAGGVLLPQLRAASFPAFKFLATDDSAPGGVDLEALCEAVDEAYPDESLTVPLAPAQRDALRGFCRGYRAGDAAGMAEALRKALDAHAAAPGDAVEWKAWGVVPPHTQAAALAPLEAAAVTVGHVKAVLWFLGDKVRRREWETTGLPDALQVPLGDEAEEAVRAALEAVARGREGEDEDVGAALEEFQRTLVSMENSTSSMLAAPRLPLAELLTQFSILDVEEDEVEAAACRGVLCCQYAALRGLLNALLREVKQVVAPAAPAATHQADPAAEEAAKEKERPREEPVDAGDDKPPAPEAEEGAVPAPSAKDPAAQGAAEPTPAAARGQPGGGRAQCWVEGTADVPERVLRVAAGDGAPLEALGMAVDSDMVVTEAGAAAAAAGVVLGMQVLKINGFAVNCAADVAAAGADEAGGFEVTVAAAAPRKKGAADRSLRAGAKVQSATAKDWTKLRRHMRAVGKQ